MTYQFYCVQLLCAVAAMSMRTPGTTHCHNMDVKKLYKSACFFPRDDGDGVSKHDKCIASGIPAFAADISFDGKKKYFSCGYEFFCTNYYKNTIVKNMYELLQYDKDTKIYIDMDSKDVGNALLFDDECKRIVTYIKDMLGDDTIRVYHLDASSDTKLSYHIIFEYFMPSVGDVMGLVMHACDACDTKYVDKGVYTKNRVFRLLYSNKFGKSSSSRLRVIGAGEDYDVEMVFRTLIQARMPPHYHDSIFNNYDGLCRKVTPLVDILPSVSVSPSCHRHMSATISGFGSSPQFLKFIELYGGLLLSCKENDNFIMCIVGDKECGHKQTKHKSNNQYFTIIKSTMMGYWKCSDPDCNPSNYDEVSMAFMRIYIKK